MPAPTAFADRELSTRDSRIAAMVLAAGASTRMGRPKQLIVHRGKPLLVRSVESAIEAGARPVIVVLGADADEIRPVLDDLAEISVVLNPRWQSGLASSISVGLRALAPDGYDGVLVILADQFLIDAKALLRLVDAFRNGARLVAAGYDGRPGAPALFGAEHVPALHGLTGDRGAREWLLEHATEVALVPFDGALVDLDTPADVQRLAVDSSFG